MSNKMLAGAGLILVTSLAAFFRLFELGLPAFRADTIEAWRLCHQDFSAFYLFGHWSEIVGRNGQFPLPMALARGLLNLFQLPPTDFWIRFSSAFFGIATVPAVFLAARQLGGRRFGLFAAALLALNPFHIQMSREAYYYTPLLLGAALLLWSAAWIYNHRNLRRNFSALFFAVTGLGFLFLTYSHLSGWWLAAALAPFILAVAVWRARNNKAGYRDLFILLAIFFLIGLPLTFVSWGIPYFIYDQLHPEIKAYSLRSGHGARPPLWDMTVGVAGRMTFGSTYGRMLFVIAALSAGLVAVVTAWRRQRRLPWLLAGAIIIVVALHLLGQWFTASPYSIRHEAVILPALLLFFSYSIWSFRLPRRVTRKWKANVRRSFAWGAAALALALNVYPAFLSTRLTGKPTPYKEIASFCDRFLPPGIPVLVDRWFEPWNELRIYNSTNVYFAFTVPDEPADTYAKNRWRETALAFFQRFPDAAYLELNRANRDLRGIVSSVPFARHAAFTNRAAISLRNLGLAYREDCYGPDLNRLIIDLFYNTRADVVERARQAGKKTVVLYGPGWGYTKLWQQTGDFRDWRLLPAGAALDIYNLTPEPLPAGLVMRGMAVNGVKRVALNDRDLFAGAGHDFGNLRLETWRWPDFKLAPGLNRISLRDPFWNSAPVPLLVDSINLDLQGQIKETP